MSYVPGGTTDAYFAVQYHVALKGLQGGAVLGLCVVTPLSYLVHARRMGRSLASVARSEALLGAALGAPLALAAGAYRLRDQPHEAIVDRAVRLAANVGQQRLDKFAATGAGAGALVGAIGFGVNPVLGLSQGGAIGIAGGVLAYLVYSRLVDQRV